MPEPTVSDSTDSQMPDLVTDSNSESNSNDDGDDHEYWEAYYSLVETERAKGLYYSCKTIRNMIENLQDKIKDLEEKESDGWVLGDGEADDYCELIPPDVDDKIRELVRSKAQSDSILT